jgi:very-short-patch-repair endonuclease
MPPHSEGKGRAHTNTPKDLYDKTKLLAREMRAQQTAAEAHLWQHIRKDQILGFKFRRQHTIDRFIVDFYCTKAHLVIEVDGSSHDEQLENDQLRTEFLESRGLRVLRFTNGEVLKQIDAVIECIAEVLQEYNDTSAYDPTPNPSP